jgi:hypothetical protein
MAAMGMYTAHRLHFRLRADTPASVIACLQALLASAEQAVPGTPDWPEHPFFAQGAAVAFFEPFLSNYREGHGLAQGGTLVQDAQGWQLTHAGASKRTSARALAALADWLGPWLVRPEGHTLGVVAFEENFQEFFDAEEANEDQGAVGFGYSAGHWTATHHALVVQQGQCELVLRAGDVLDVALP